MISDDTIHLDGTGNQLSACHADAACPEAAAPGGNGDPPIGRFQQCRLACTKARTGRTTVPTTLPKTSGAPMRDDAAIITETLERVAERIGDPTPLVFKRLFDETPDLEDLFVRDSDGLVRGQMFQMTIESLLDFLGDRSYGANLIQIERVNHQGLGVDPEVFDTFYLTVLATFRTILGADWTADMEAAWTRAVRELTRISA
jgi:hemoglobin-like flavoprotein